MPTQRERSIVFDTVSIVFALIDCAEHWSRSLAMLRGVADIPLVHTVLLTALIWYGHSCIS